MNRDLLERLEAILVAVEFAGKKWFSGSSDETGDWSEDACPMCESQEFESQRHSPDCQLAEMLRLIRSELEDRK